MSQTFDIYEPLIYGIFAILIWLTATVIVLGFVWVSKEKENEEEAPDLKTRTWKRIQFANHELFPLLNMQEKKDMMQLLNTTAANAEMFKNIKFEQTNNILPRKSPKESAKRVVFNV